MIDLKELEFYESTHRYFYKGRLLLGVNEVFERTGLSSFAKISWEILEASKITGEYAHEIAKLYALKRLNESTVDPRLEGYLRCIKKFFKMNVRKVLAVEIPICDPYHGYAGTPDIIYVNHSGKICLDDYKTPEKSHPVWPLQTSAYKQAWDKCFQDKKIYERAGVMLSRDGIYQDSRDRVRHTDPQDFDDFVSALRLANIKIKNNIHT